MKRVSRNWAEYNESLSQLPTLEIEKAGWFPPLKSLLGGASMSVLEIGCSNGRYLVALGALIEARELVGIDIIPCKTPDSVHFIQADGMRLPFGDSTFDFVYSLGVLEHFKPDGRASLISEQARVLKPGGVIMVVIPNCTPGSLRFAKTKVLDMFREFRHEAVLPSQLRKEMLAKGIDVTFERYIGSSLHLGRMDMSRLNPLPGSMVLSDDFAIIGRRRVGA